MPRSQSLPFRANSIGIRIASTKKAGPDQRPGSACYSIKSNGVSNGEKTGFPNQSLSCSNDGYERGEVCSNVDAEVVVCSNDEREAVGKLACNRQVQVHSMVLEQVQVHSKEPVQVLEHSMVLVPELVHSKVPELEHSKELVLVLVHSKEPVQVLEHSMVLVLEHSMVLEQVHSKVPGQEHSLELGKLACSNAHASDDFAIDHTSSREELGSR